MATDNPKKCAHPPCTCTPRSGKYCSAQCEAMEKARKLTVAVVIPTAEGKHTRPVETAWDKPRVRLPLAAWASRNCFMRLTEYGV
jgi:hypothetical protein